jgi:tetratricopeptide (TPR) repeat protein
MKKITLLLVICSFSKIYAQSINLDKEKLLDFYQTQRYADAAVYLQSIYPANTTDLKALGQMAYCNMMAGKLADAEATYLKINELQPNSLSTLFNLVNIYNKRGNNILAKKYLTNIIAKDSTNFNAYKQLANLTDSSELKLDYLKKASFLNDVDADVAYDLAIAYKKVKKFEQAYQVLKIAITADTNNFILQRAQLPIANMLKKYTEVVTLGEKLLQIEMDENVVKDVGKAHFFLKNYQKCIGYYHSLEALDAHNETILYFMALSYRELKNYEMAVSYAKKTIEKGISENTAFYHEILGNMYNDINQHTKAKNAYQKGLTFKPEKSIYYHLALLYDFKLKDQKNALSYYKIYLKSKPDAVRYKVEIEYVKNRVTEMQQVKKL